MVAYPIAIEPSSFHSVTANNHSWMSKVVKYGEVAVTDKELDDYFTTTSDGNYVFGIKVNGETKFYEVEFREYALSPELSYIKAFKLPQTSENVKQLDAKNLSWLQQSTDNEFRWIEIDQSEARSLKQFTSDDDFNFKVIKSDGKTDNYNIRYFGKPLSAIGEK